MTSNNRASTGPPQRETIESASAPIAVYVLSYNAKDWISRVTLLDGSEPRDEQYGALNVYRSLSNARDAGTEWALKQLQHRLGRYHPPLRSNKDRDVAFDDWPKSESEQDEFWSYTISKDDETLVVKAEKFVAYAPYALRFNDGGKEGVLAGKGTQGNKK